MRSMLKRPEKKMLSWRNNTLDGNRRLTLSIIIILSDSHLSICEASYVVFNIQFTHSSTMVLPPPLSYHYPFNIRKATGSINPQLNIFGFTLIFYLL